MEKGDQRFSQVLRCPFCKHVAPMRVVSEYSQVREYQAENHDVVWDAGPVYQLMLCPACDRIMLQRGFYHSLLYPDDWKPEVLHPQDAEIGKGLPPSVKAAYEDALKVRSINANAFGVMMRRLLEIVCKDRGAKGKSLYDQLKDLAQRDEIPKQLVDIANGLRQLGNIGAHAAAGELTEAEVPYLDGLGRTILEYVYYAPHMLEEVQKRLNALSKSR